MTKYIGGSKVRGFCGCGKPTMSKGRDLEGNTRWSSGCSACRYKARKHKKDYCEDCGSTKNLEVDHIDGNRGNNNLDNLQTLCRHCHISKTVREKDNIA